MKKYIDRIMYRLILSIVGLVFGSGAFLVFKPSVTVIAPGAEVPAVVLENIAPPSASEPTATSTNTPPVINASSSGDIPFQEQLSNPPEIAKGIYVSAWSAGTPSRMRALADLAKRTELNAVVIDVKDYSGYVSYAMDVPLVREIGADRELRIREPNRIIKELHDANVYAIARITVFQDSILAKAHPEWAVKNKSTGGLWKDNKGIAWLDPAAKPVWDYHVAIAKDALARGFDEVNFDYIRFPSDGPLAQAEYPFWDGVSRATTMREFYAYLRSELAGEKISADLFGLVTVNRDDLGIGQVIEDAYKYFDYVCPMVYPSHYASGFIGYKNPGAYPYEVMKYSLDRARDRREALVIQIASTTGASPAEVSAKMGKLRPWIQDFNLGATYTAAMVRSEFRAVYDSLVSPSSSDAYAGWYIWDPANTYTEAALGPEEN